MLRPHEILACMPAATAHELFSFVFEKEKPLYRATIESLAQRFLHHLRALISLRTTEDARRFSPGDFPLAALSQQSLDTVLRQAGPDVEDLYPLSPTQQGLLFHTLLTPGSSTYFEQFSWSVSSALDLRYNGYWQRGKTWQEINGWWLTTPPVSRWKQGRCGVT